MEGGPIDCQHQRIQPPFHNVYLFISGWIVVCCVRNSAIYEVYVQSIPFLLLFQGAALNRQPQKRCAATQIGAARKHTVVL